MRLTLKIDNMDALPDGGPLAFTTGERSIMIGRETSLDWTLPDPSGFISRRHCEVRFENGAFQLYDNSANGTFLNGGTQRIKSPYRLSDGDRLSIGHYIVAVSLAAGDAPDFASYDDIWASAGHALPPIDRRELMPPKPQGVRAVDFPGEFIALSQFQEQSAPPGPPPAPPFPRPAGAPPFDIAPQPFPFSEQPAFDGAPLPEPAAVPPMSAPPSALPGPFASPDRNPFRSEPFDSLPVQPLPVAPSPLAPAAPPRREAQPPLWGDSPLAPAPVAPPPPVPSPLAPASHPALPRPARAPSSAAGDATLARIAKGAGIPLDVLTARDPGEVAEEIGQVLRIAVEEVAELLRRRSAVRRMARSARTMVSLSDNNPMKFIPRTEEMLEVMFAGRRGYMDARRSMSESFADLRRHEFATYSAMKEALLALLEDLAPESVEKKVGGTAFSFRKARAWDLFVASWIAKTEPHENGMLDVFLTYFGEAYEKASASKDQD